MQGVVEILKGWQLHPVVDHFTVALILVGIVIDLCASLAPGRPWLRSMAATLMVLGAAAAIGSKFTGGWEAERVWDNVNGPAKQLLERHAWWGDILPYFFAGLAIWRLGVQFIGFFARTRFVYLLAALAAGGAILYQGDLGGDLVYEYGVGTALMSTQTSAPAAAPTAAEAPAPIPTVYVPPPTPAPPAATATPAAPASSPTVPPPVAAAVVPSATPTPASATGTEVSPPPGPPAAGGDASPASKPTTL